MTIVRAVVRHPDRRTRGLVKPHFVHEAPERGAFGRVNRDRYRRGEARHVCDDFRRDSSHRIHDAMVPQNRQLSMIENQSLVTVVISIVCGTAICDYFVAIVKVYGHSLECGRIVAIFEARIACRCGC
jgi:hypothetical protein